MQYLPEIDCEIPSLDILSLIFDSPIPWAKPDTVVSAEAGNEANCMTKAELEVVLKRLSYAFRHRLGVGAKAPGQDVVTCMSSNHLLLPAIFMGVIGAGGVYASASSALTVGELTRQIQGSGSKILIVSEDLRATATEAARTCGIPPERVLIIHAMGRRRALTPLANSQNYLDETRELPWEKITNQKALEDRTAALLYSSGTTGPPKGVRLSHANFVAEAIITQNVLETYLSRTGRRVHVDYHYRAIAHLPATHIAGLQGYFLNNIMAGGTVFWLSKFVWEKFVAAVARHKPTFLPSVPAVYLRIAKDPAVTDQFHSVENAQSGAAPMGIELQKMAEKKFKCRISQSWGLTETTGAVTWLPWDRVDDTGSISQLMPNTRMKIVDDNGKSVPDGHAGEILVRGPNLTSGYWNNPAATKEAITEDGWLRTGDIGLRRDAKFYIIDRKKELIKYKGLQISPAELEAVLVANSQILDAAVIGVPDPSLPGNEIPRAFVVQKPEATPITAEQVKGLVAAELAPYKQLKGGVEFVKEIPRNASGKILRRMLRDQWAAKSKPQAKL